MKLYHKILGEGDPLFILHGLFGSSDNWNTLAKRFAEDRKVILVDQRNHGRSFHDEEMNYAVMAHDMVMLMDDLGIEKADMLGHSMGGKTVMRLAMEWPERINRLLVADIGPKVYESHHDLILEALHAVALDEVKSRSEAIAVMKESLSQEGVLQFLAKNLYWKEKGELAWRMNLAVIERHMDDILDSVGSNTYAGDSLFIRGSESGYIQDEDLMALSMQFPESIVETIDGAGHWLHAEQPERFFNIVTDYLS